MNKFNMINYSFFLIIILLSINSPLVSSQTESDTHSASFFNSNDDISKINLFARELEDLFKKDGEELRNDLNYLERSLY